MTLEASLFQPHPPIDGTPPTSIDQQDRGVLLRTVVERVIDGYQENPTKIAGEIDHMSVALLAFVDSYPETGTLPAPGRKPREIDRSSYELGVQLAHRTYREIDGHAPQVTPWDTARVRRLEASDLTLGQRAGLAVVLSSTAQMCGVVEDRLSRGALRGDPVSIQKGFQHMVTMVEMAHAQVR